MPALVNALTFPPFGGPFGVMRPSTDPCILLARRLTEAQAARLRSVAPGARIIGEEDISSNPRLASLFSICYPRLPPGLWRSATGLRWLQTDIAGVDSLLRLAEARTHPAVITNIHIHGNCVAEHLWGMTLMLTRNLHRAARLQERAVWDCAPLSEGLSSLAGRTLCIAGLGAIGERCAAMGRAFGMRVIGIRRHPRPSAAADEVVGPEARREAFARARVIMLLLPDTPDARPFVGRDELDVMQGAFLLNAGRGASVDTDGLVAALREGKVRGAGLDVTDPEPLPKSHPLWEMANVVITPHYAGVHLGYDEEAFDVFMANLGRWVRGEPLENVVDKEAGY
jgi:phosphoglycerate dehydrogenase-like enzyme